jgi:hypothetical protein
MNIEFDKVERHMKWVAKSETSAHQLVLITFCAKRKTSESGDIQQLVLTTFCSKKEDSGSRVLTAIGAM